jgi:hypothetical protein
MVMARTVLLRRIGRVAFAAFVLAVVAAGTALASRSVLGEGEVLYACAQNPSGVLRLVNDLSECRAPDKAVQWNVQGPEGPRGPQGPDGPPGPSDAFSAKAGNEITIPTGSPYTLLTLSDLPAGNYAIFATVVAHNLNSQDTTPVLCHLVTPSDTSLTYSARIDPFTWRGLGAPSGASTMTIALSLTTQMSTVGQVSLQCYSNHISPTATALAGARQITAIKVGNLVQQ